MDDQGTDREGGGIMKTLFATFLALITVVGHIITGVLFYRYVWGSDFVVFFLPTLIAIAVNTLIIGTAMPAKWRSVSKYAVAIAVAVVVGIVAEMVSLTVAFNMYGT